MILRFQVIEHEKENKIIDFEFDGISKALDFLMKGRPISDFKFDISQYLLYTRGSIDNLVYQVTLLDNESKNPINLENMIFKVVTRCIDRQEFIEKICLEDEIMDFAEESKRLYSDIFLPIHTYNGLPAERVA